MSLRERFDKKWRLEDAPGCGCWIWTASKTALGYGQIITGSKRDGTHRPAKAHRVAYELYRGPIAGGLVIDHLCRNPRCVNPWHLEPVTHEENMRRGLIFEVAKARAERTHCSNGHPFIEANTATRNDGWCRRCKACHQAVNTAYRKRLKTKGSTNAGA